MKKQPKTRRELFVKILNMWLENEYQCIDEWCIKDRYKVKLETEKQYEDYLKLWEKLDEIERKLGD